MKLNWHEYFLQIAKTVSLRASCPRLSVGAVIVSKDRNILSTGFNGSPRSAKECLEYETRLEHMGRQKCDWAVHAELNAIISAARNGVGIKGATLYITHSPCYECCKHIINSGISNVIFREEFYRIENILNFLTSNGVQIQKFEEGQATLW